MIAAGSTLEYEAPGIAGAGTPVGDKDPTAEGVLCGDVGQLGLKSASTSAPSETDPREESEEPQFEDGAEEGDRAGLVQWLVEVSALR